MEGRSTAGVPNFEREQQFELLLCLAATIQALDRKLATSQGGHHAGPKEKPSHEEIEVRAYQIFVERGLQGNDVENWLQAERELIEKAWKDHPRVEKM
jgi:hypothetical protein